MGRRIVGLSAISDIIGSFVGERVVYFSRAANMGIGKACQRRSVGQAPIVIAGRWGGAMCPRNFRRRNCGAAERVVSVKGDARYAARGRTPRIKANLRASKPVGILEN